MSKNTVITTSISLIILGISVLCLGAEEIEFLPQLTDATDLDNKANVQLMRQVVQQYASKYNNNEEDGSQKKILSEASTNGNAQSSNSQEEPDNEDDHSISKRQTQFQRNNADDLGFKSRPGFRSWGGKRTKFCTWGGKRGSMRSEADKRSRFSNWGGKRSVNDVPEILYGGTSYGTYEDGEDMEKRDTFKSWGGKRGSVLVSPIVKRDYGSQSRFSNWGGKRDLEYPMPYGQNLDFVGDNDIKKEFQSWGGKRPDQAIMKHLSQLDDRQLLEIIQFLQNLLLQDDIHITKKSGFSPWKGRR